MLYLFLALAWMLVSSGPGSPMVSQDALLLGRTLVADVATPTPTTTEREAPQPVGLGVVAALFCLFNLSSLALVGSIALKRYFDGINPDDGR
ncbi:hypothetical protein [Candidatus Viridilinea mediisalina]|uniref:Uncharacterized protein n=1 Tax=Candidatus Viridilinea mediisalina TaxID=2024553 RepID=A0A2A6RK94_9CHLR|nr:hypothetical protein [Candidatus Viridilinea mediisalina]PDW03306.1 hypothetical protein CJ255_09320 [Candidatus Viridilinea mediisalina]